MQRAIQLSDVTEILLGYPFRERLEKSAPRPGAEPSAQLLVLQAKDLTEDGGVIFDEAAVVADFHKSWRFEVQPGVIAFQPRGVTYRAALIGDLPRGKRAILAAPLYLIRPRSTDAIDPAYLIAFLNSPATQATLRLGATGSALPQVSRKVLDSLEVPLPPIDKQRRLGQLARLANERKRIEWLIHEKTLALIAAASIATARTT